MSNDNTDGALPSDSDLKDDWFTWGTCCGRRSSTDNIDGALPSGRDPGED